MTLTVSAHRKAKHLRCALSLWDQVLTRPRAADITMHPIFVIARSESDVAICSRHIHLENANGQFET